MCCPWWSIISNKQVSYIQANYVLERKKKIFSKQPNKWIFRRKQNSAKEILNITWNVDLFCVFKKELGCRKLHQKQSVISKDTTKEMETVRFRSSEWWQFFKLGTGIDGPMIYLDQDHIPSSTTSLWKHWCVGNLIPAGIHCQILPSADSFLVFFQFLFLPRKCSIAILMLHFGQLWQAASRSEGRTETTQNTGSWAHLVLKKFTIEPWCDLFVCNTVRRTTLSWVRR